jgi:hypothetical protein
MDTIKAVSDSGAGKVALVAGLVGTVVMLGTGIGISMVGGTSFIDALGIGAFAALWGGPGFGGMAGGIYYVSREERRRAAEGAAGH